MKILMLDIETAPNIAHVWGLWQQNVGLTQLIASGYTLCWAAKWYGEEEMHYASTFSHGVRAMLLGIHSLLDEADAVVHYNGNKFDVPTLNKEFLLHEMAPPNPTPNIDLLSVAKKRFRFPSNKLDHIANELGLGEKLKHIGHQLWVGCMNDDPESWAMMEDYNKQDVVLLEKVYVRMLPWIQGHPNHALYTDEDRPVCPNCGGVNVKKNGTETTKVMEYQRYRCVDCGTPLRGRYSVTDIEKKRMVLTQSKL